MAGMMQAILERYHEEQVWSDKVSRLSPQIGRRPRAPYQGSGLTLRFSDLRNPDPIDVYVRIPRDHLAQRPPLSHFDPSHRAVATETTGRKRRRKVCRLKDPPKKRRNRGLSADLRDAAVIPQTAKERRGWSRDGASPARVLARASGAGAG